MGNVLGYQKSQSDDSLKNSKGDESSTPRQTKATPLGQETHSEVRENQCYGGAKVGCKMREGRVLHRAL